MFVNETVIISAVTIMFLGIQLVAFFGDNLVKANFIVTQFNSSFQGFDVEDRMFFQRAFKNFCHSLSMEV